MNSRPKRRQIRVGHQIVTGSVCSTCIMKTVIFPESSMDDHMRRHALNGMQPRTVSRNLGAGRHPGGKNKKQMSSTGVECAQGIRRAR